MTTKSLFLTVRRVTLCLCLAISFVAVAVPARADNPPKFKDPEVTAFFQKVSDTLDALLVAVKAKDEAKTKELNTKMETLMKEGDPLKAKVTPEEDEAVSKWFTTQIQKLSEAGFAPGQ